MTDEHGAGELIGSRILRLEPAVRLEWATRELEIARLTTEDTCEMVACPEYGHGGHPARCG